MLFGVGSNLAVLIQNDDVRDACFRTAATGLDRPAGSAGSLFSTRGVVDEPVSSASNSNMFANTGTGVWRENQGGFLDNQELINIIGNPSDDFLDLSLAFGPQVRWLTP